MNNFLIMLDQMMPGCIGQFQVRYCIMQTILECQPIGRRSLAIQTGYSERVVRGITESLSEQGLIVITSTGMEVTESGKYLLIELEPVLETLYELPDLAERIRSFFKARKVIVVHGNVDEDESAKWRLGEASGKLVMELMEAESVVAITGGSTVAKLVETLPNSTYLKKDVTIIAARGSVGNKIELQANTLATTLAKKIGAAYELLTVPDNLSHNAIETIKEEPHIQETLQKISQSDMMIMGLGNAIKMATRRHEMEETIALLKEKGAVAEAFRYYFDSDGKVVHSTSNIGLSIDIAMRIPKRVIVAGGKQKALALMATTELLLDSYLVIDEGVARSIIEDYFITEVSIR